MWSPMWHILCELAPWLLLGAAVAGALHVLLPPNFVRRQLRGRGGVLKAVAIGVPLPLCSCGVIPAGLGLKKDGASDGAAVGFLISTPQTGVDSILVSAGFLGWPFAIFKVVAAVVTGVVGGWSADAWVAGGGSELEGTSEAARPRTLREAAHYALDLVRMIWRWIAFGVIISAAILAYSPPDLFAPLVAAGGLVTLLGVLAFSLPLYVCATASVPIAAALVAAGLPTGAALVFLMAGPATNLATIGAIRRGLGNRALIIYLATIIVGSVGFGLLFEAFFDVSGFAAAQMHHEMSWWGNVAGAGLLAMLAAFAASDLRDLWRRFAPKAGATECEIGVEGLTCQGCARRLRGELEKVEGVVAADVNVEQNLALIRGRVDPQLLRAAVERAGFTPTG